MRARLQWARVTAADHLLFRVHGGIETALRSPALLERIGARPMSAVEPALLATEAFLKANSWSTRTYDFKQVTGSEMWERGLPGPRRVPLEDVRRLEWARAPDPLGRSGIRAALPPLAITARQVRYPQRIPLARWRRRRFAGLKRGHQAAAQATVVRAATRVQVRAMWCDVM